MSRSVLIDTALRLPAPDTEALVQGRLIAAMPRVFITSGLKFALYPSEVSINLLPPEQHYRLNYLPIVRATLANLSSEKVLIKAWAKCELCQGLNDPESLKALSRSTIWTIDALEETLSKRNHIFLAYLRVYPLPYPIEVPTRSKGQFVALPTPITVLESSPVLSDRVFAQRKDQLEKLEPPLHPELEELQAAITQFSSSEARQLDQEIRQLLGWARNLSSEQSNLKPAWINSIVELGERSKEQDKKKSNYQAGTDFENVVRDSLSFLGFTIDKSHEGGAGGLDLFCSKPYPLAGECKAGKSIPSGTTEELMKLSGMHLDEFIGIAKLVIGPGQPTSDLQIAAKKFRISIINPMTLQKLVELKAKYPGSVNLMKLKQYLEPGQIDYRIDEYIDKVQGEIKLRSQLIQAVKELDSEQPTVVEIRTLYNARFAKDSSSKLGNQLVHDLLVELSSPLTGYLGREKGSDWQSDRFYFLRDLPIDKT